MVAARAEYRVYLKHGTSPDKCVEDGKSAVRWIRVHAGELGVDSERIVASGASAGGHVAACTGILEGYEAAGEEHSISSKPGLLVLFNPAMVTDYRISTMIKIGSKEMAENLSPNRHLKPRTPPLIMFFGAEDFHLKGARETMEIVRNLGLEAELWIAEDQSHGFYSRKSLGGLDPVPG